MDKILDKKENYITLKEASKMSGYASDYIGQLIRSGKLPGKQIYINTAWVTTEEAVMEYVQKSKQQGNAKTGLIERTINKIRQKMLNLRSLAGLNGFLSMVLYLSLALSIIFAILLFYIFSNFLDDKIKERAIKSAKGSELRSF